MSGLQINPKVLRWAWQRAGLTQKQIFDKHPKAKRWVQGNAQPTVAELKEFGKTVRAGLGYLVLPAPPEEMSKLPIADFRGKTKDKLPSLDLLETIYSCQSRQNWYRDHLLSIGRQELPFIGSVKSSRSITRVASDIRRVVNFEANNRTGGRDATLRHLIRKIRDAGILVMVNGVVGNNPKRPLDTNEFRGFALSDAIAPLIFINGADAKAAQLFTLAHELAHLWIGKEGLSLPNLRLTEIEDATEQWCNAVAAEVLVPQASIADDKVDDESAGLSDKVVELSKKFKVSNLVILRRLYDTKKISKKCFYLSYDREDAETKKRLEGKDRTGGNYPAMWKMRVDENFARALIYSTIAGETLFTDAFDLLDVKGTASLKKRAGELGIKM